METTPEYRTSWLDRPILTSLTINWESLIFASILILGLLSRFYNLEPRVMSHDENSHVYYSWRLYKGDGYQHTPLTHGPLLFHLTAFSYFLFGDSDTTARIPFALFGVAAIAFVWFYRRYLGRAGTMITAILVLISPYMLYYSRYVRNEAFVAFFGVVTIWSVLRYLETGEAKYTYWVTAATVLHFTAKETAFIYTAQVLLFLGFIFIYQVTQQKWRDEGARKAFLWTLIAGFVFLAMAGGISIVAGNATAPVEGEVSNSGFPTIFLAVPIILSGISFLAALYFVIRDFTWKEVCENRAFSLMVLLLTLILPHLAAFPARLAGWDPLDYSWAGILHTAVFLVPLALIAIALGLLWNRRLWLTNAAIFYVPFTLLYTTFFTNGNGFFSGLVGSLGYWLEQQGVQRGSQPWYYYTLLQVPFYEFLPALGVLLTLGIIISRKLSGRLISDDEPVALPDETEIVAESHPRGQVLFLLLTGFWIITSVIAYSIAGEKMPWLTVHIALPIILFSGWGFGQLVEGINWSGFISQRGLLLIVLILVFLISLSTALGIIMGPNRPFSGQELNQLNTSLNFVFSLLLAIGSGVAIGYLIKDWVDLGVLGKVTLLVFFSLLGVLTARAAYRAAYINYDNPTEYLVYAHSATGVKEALAQIEELSIRTTDGLDMQVAYDDETTYPYWWYLRDYTNQKYYGASPTRELRDAPVILVGDNNFAKIEPVVGQAYHQFDYNRIWWPNQDYYNLTWERIKNAITNPAMRAAIWDIWLNRDYTQYAEVTGKTDLTLPTWSPSDRMRLYVRKDIAAQVWNLGAAPSTTEEILADPYEGKGVSLIADQIIGDQGMFNLPRNLAVAADGTLYVADTGNHRIVQINTNGEVLNSWGSFADSATMEGGAPPGTFYEPWSVAIGTDGSVFVADTWNHRIQKFTPDGRFLTQWGVFGQAETSDAFWGPRDIAIDSDGQVYITDTGNKRVVVFDENGNYITEFGGAGLLPGQFDEPVGIAVDEAGLVYVADTWNQRIQVFKYDPQSNLFVSLREWDIVGWYGQSLENKPYLRVNAAEHVFVSDPEGYRILEFTSEGEFVRYWGDYGNDPSGFVLPNGLAIDPESGALWVADSGNNRLMHFNIDSGE